MSFVSWNCRGLGNLSAVPKLKFLVRYYNPDAIFLSETLVHINKIEEFRYMLGYDYCFAPDRVGRGGGIALFWRKTINCTIVNYSSNHINAKIEENNNNSWLLTGFYGYPEGGRRRDSWNFIRQLAGSTNLPWCIFGDFNDILHAQEKKGRTERSNWLIRGFRQAVTDAGLIDMHMEGYPFTWFKSLGTPRVVEEKLDRAMANEAWMQLFPHARLENLVAPSSDHFAILLERAPVQRPYRGRKTFKFEIAWMVEEGLNEVVQNSWQLNAGNNVMSKLSACAEELTHWSKSHCNKLRIDIEDCRKELNRCRGNAGVENEIHFEALRKKMTQLLVQDDMYWRQRAKTYWYREGDLNTKYFHAAATSRKKVNAISFLENDDGIRISDDVGMRNVAKQYFEELFEEKISTTAPVINVLNRVISADDIRKLTAPFQASEFKDAMFAMQPDKCPGPDGFNPGFYQHFWSTCSGDIYRECCQWLNEGQFPPSLNATNIALIPKGNEQKSMKDWRPIALCNVLYKLVSKVLANRLKSVLHKCISETQSTFVPGRSILDNALVAIELVHHMKTKTRIKERSVALKLDISKAYDRIDWAYLKDVMIKMGFSNRWIDWIMMCVKTVDYSVIVNKDMVGPIIPGRGLRQGDPLSPYLFILCAEGLSALIRDAETRGELQGIRVCRTAPVVSHLLFADDCFLFFQAEVSQANVMRGS
jgi:hypothetical protein